MTGSNSAIHRQIQRARRVQAIVWPGFHIIINDRLLFFFFFFFAKCSQCCFYILSFRRGYYPRQKKFYELQHVRRVQAIV